MSAGSTLPSMSNAAFAGFLRLMLTPLNEAPDPSPELRAYLDYLSRVYPPENRRQVASLPTVRIG
jgi:hypothetical protein